MEKQSLNIGISSMPCWLFLDGNMDKPIRAFADANCDVGIGLEKMERDGKFYGEKATSDWKIIEYSPKHIVKLRDNWDGFTDEKHYGKIITKAGSSPFLK